MASTFTTNLHLELQGTGDNSGTWGAVLNTTALAIIDQAMGGTQTISVSSLPVTISTSQSQNNTFLFTGTLTADVTVTFPAIGRTIFLKNNTTGSFKLTIACGTPGTTVILPAGASGYFTLNVNDVLIPTMPATGPLKDIAGAATIDLGTIVARNANVTGTGWTTSSFGSSASTALPLYCVRFNSTGTLVHNATSLQLPGNENISVEAGDTLEAMYLGSSNWRVVQYTRKALSPGNGYTYLRTFKFTSNGTYTPSDDCRYIRASMWGGGGGGGGVDSSANKSAGAGGGGQGAYSEYNGAVPGSPRSIVVGNGGPGGSSGGGDGTNGSSSSISGGLASAPGGSGGGGVATGGGQQVFGGAFGAGGSPGTGTVTFGGQDGGVGWGLNDGGTTFGALGGQGGGQGGGHGGVLGSGTSSASSPGGPGTNYGGGGGGSCAQGGPNIAGGAGGDGIVLIDEYG